STMPAANRATPVADCPSNSSDAATSCGTVSPSRTHTTPSAGTQTIDCRAADRSVGSREPRPGAPGAVLPGADAGDPTAAPWRACHSSRMTVAGITVSTLTMLPMAIGTPLAMPYRL